MGEKRVSSNSLNWHVTSEELPEVDRLVLIQLKDKYTFTLAQLDDYEGSKEFLAYSNIWYDSWSISEVLRWAYIDLDKSMFD